jgi:hypothetical protein
MQFKMSATAHSDVDVAFVTGVTAVVTDVGHDIFISLVLMMMVVVVVCFI